MTTRYPTRELGVPFVVHAMQLAVAYNTTGISSGVPFSNYLPQDAQLVCAIVRITAAFNAVSSNVLTVGTNSTSFNDIAASGDIDEATTGVDVVWTGADLDTSSAPLLPYVKYTQTGDAATAGAAVITLLYVPKIDR
jgi:hypothetical protein